jgi:hypothetical protein
MDAVSALTSSAATDTTSNVSQQGLSNLDPGAFMDILIKQLQYQDPFKPMDNEQMLSQISQIRNMEMSMTLTDSLQQLTDQQRLGSASTMIGQYVTGKITSSSGDETVVAGVVRGVEFDGKGQPILQLDNGGKLPLKDLSNVVDVSRLIGKHVEGQATGDDGQAVAVEGTVVAVSYDVSGQAWLELDSGDSLPVANLSRVSDPAQASTLFG